jgi:hypothetical protein
VAIPAAIPTPTNARDAYLVAREIRSARAYRDGQLVCSRVSVTVTSDDRLGFAPRERRRVIGARFTERVDANLRGELAAVVRRRGAAARRAAERIAPIEVVDDEGRRIIGRLEPPRSHHGDLCDIEFAVRELAS